MILVQKNPMCYNWEKGVLYENRHYETNGNGTVENGRRRCNSQRFDKR